MRYTFNLKKPNKDGKSLVLFSAYFRDEGRKFVYSTGELIAPEQWDYEHRQPKNTNGRTQQAKANRNIKKQLDRYGSFFNDTVTHFKEAKKEFIIDAFKDEFDKEFKRTSALSKNFFEVYDLFIHEKRNDYTDEANSETTIKRYEYNKKLLKDFQDYRKKKIHFNQINKGFYNELLKFSINQKKHSANTTRRNIGLFKTFLYWALEYGHTYKTDFQKFKAPKAEQTDEVALTIDQIQEVFDYDFSKNPKLEKVRDLFIFGCSTGMRISNYAKVSKKDIEDGQIKVRDAKNSDKVLKVPLNEISIYILKKYEYSLPTLSTQKFNIYIKEVFKQIGFDWEVKKSIRIGKEIIEEISPFYERISSHTARRSFITVMKNKRVPDKVIMDITGHKSLEVFNKYYKPNDAQKAEFMQIVWSMNNAPLKKVN